MSGAGPPHRAVLGELRAAVGPGHVLVDGDLTAAFARDWTGRWQGEPLAVVRPGSTAEVAAVVAACGRAGVPLVPQGGNTGLVGAGVPRDGEVVLSTRRLNRLDAVDPAARTVVAGAGVPLARAQAHARRAGLDVGIDFAARDSATLGGIAATNAGGERVMRHGTTRSQVLGVEAVLADGSVVRRLAGLPKDNSGYDLTQLLVGSEGTLGVLTAVMLRLVPRADRRSAALLAVGRVGQAVEALVSLRARLPELDAAEFFTEAGLHLVLSRSLAAHPFDAAHPVYLLVEVAAAGVNLPADQVPLERDERASGGRDDGLTDRLTDALAELEGLRDAVVAESAADRRRLWQLREGHTEAISAAGVPVKLDVAVPLERLEGFVRELPQVVAAVAPSAVPVLFGHLAEGNVHVNVLGATRADADGAVTDAVLRLVAATGGSISAEHGIGRAKRRWLGLTREPADIAAMRAVKAALDPLGILSPGRVLPD